MDKDTDTAAFRAWLKSWHGPPGKWTPSGGCGSPPTIAHWAGNLSHPSELEHMNPNGVSDLLRDAGLSDRVYRAGLSALESGELDDSEIGTLCALAHLRIWAAAETWLELQSNLPLPTPTNRGVWSLVERASTVFIEYWWDCQQRIKEDEAIARINEAAIALADVLCDSGRSGYYQVTDATVWEIAWGQEKVAEIRDRSERDPRRFVWPPDAGYALRLENYLRALVKLPPPPDGGAFKPEILPQKKQSRKLRPYVLRWLRDRAEMIWPERVETGHSLNKIAARFAAIILAEPVVPNDVAAAAKAAGMARSYWKE